MSPQRKSDAVDFEHLVRLRLIALLRPDRRKRINQFSASSLASDVVDVVVDAEATEQKAVLRRRIDWWAPSVRGTCIEFHTNDASADNMKNMKTFVTCSMRLLAFDSIEF